MSTHLKHVFTNLGIISAFGRPMGPPKGTGAVTRAKQIAKKRPKATHMEAQGLPKGNPAGPKAPTSGPK